MKKYAVLFLGLTLMRVLYAANYTLSYRESSNVMSSTGSRADVDGISPLSYSGVVVIPTSYEKINETFMVMGISAGAFTGSNLTELKIPSEIMQIRSLGTCSYLKRIILENKSFKCSYQLNTYFSESAFSGSHADCVVFVPKGFYRSDHMNPGLYDGESYWKHTYLKPGELFGGRPIEWFHYHVKFNANGGSGTMPEQTIYTDETTNLTANAFTRSGYKFSGWATSASGGIAYSNKASVKNLDTGIDATVNLYAVWAANNYSVKFNANGGSGTMPNQSFVYGEAKNLTVNAFTRTGYTFQGWATSASGTKVYSDKQSVKNLTSSNNGTVNLYAVWAANNYIVKFDANDGSGAISNQSFVYGEVKNLTANAFTRTGYTFQGWATSASGEEVVYSDSQSVSNLTKESNGIVNLYAIWAAHNYSVKFNANGGSGSMANQSFVYGEWKKLTANAFTRTGYTFQGWATSASGVAICSDKESVRNLTSVDNGTVELYAVWESVLSVSVLSAKQRYPWNGLIDVKCILGGEAGQECNVSLLVKDEIGGTNIPARTFWLVGGNTTNNVLTVKPGNLHFVWDANADIAEDGEFPAVSITVNAAVASEAEEDNHEKVQLWEGGPYWATTNIGAEKPEDYGYYFWWGDTIGYKRENNTWVASDGSNSNFSFPDPPTYGKSILTLKSEGWITSEGVLAPEHDAANIHWGNGWRMPTEDELSALNKNCDWTWTTQNGVNGYVVKGRGDYASKSIFLPAAGEGFETSLYNSGSLGRYWSSVPDSNYDGSACYLFFSSSDHSTYSYGRYDWLTIRPLSGFAK